MDLKEIQAAMETKFADLKKQVEEKTTGVTVEVFEALETKYNNLVDEMKEAKSKDQTDVTLKAMQDHLDTLDIKLQKKEVKGMLTKQSFFEQLGGSLAKASKGLEDLKNKKINEFSLEVKSTVDADLENTTHNFVDGAYAPQVTEVRGLRESAFSPLWFRNYLPGNTTDGSVVQYLKENGNNGAVAVWDGTGDIDSLTEKPGVSPKFDFVTDNVIWIAGLTRIKREMLDDLSWLRGYLGRKLLTGKKGLYVAENTQILGVLTAGGNSTAYDGTQTNFLEAVYDAAFGQLLDNYHYPTTIFVNNRDMVNLIALNKASDSGLYDLPPNTVVVVNGQMTIGGIPVIGTPQINANKFLVINANETEFITRMSPEVRFFEQDKDNVGKNLITVRVEERILPIVYDKTAVIYGEAAAVPSV